MVYETDKRRGAQGKEGKAKSKLARCSLQNSERLEAERGGEGEQSDAVEHVHQPTLGASAIRLRALVINKRPAARQKCVGADEEHRGELARSPTVMLRVDVARDEFEGCRTSAPPGRG